MTPPHLVARTRPLGSDPDLIALCTHDDMVVSTSGVGLLGVGVATRIDATRSTMATDVASALGSMEVDDAVDHPGTGPVALGALPFDPNRDGSFVVPRIVIGRATDGTAWVTTIAPADSTPADLEIHQILERSALSSTGFARDAALHGSDDASSRFSIEPVGDPAQWCDAVGRATDLLRRGIAEKVVMARAVDVTADRPLHADAILAQLRRSFPGSHLFSIDGFIGASPELLVERDGEIVRAHPMAGTAPRNGDPEADARLAAALLDSTNTRAEHRHTIDMVHDTLLPWCSYLDEEAEPSIVAVANVQHLATKLEGRLSEPIASVLDLVAALHPTPAVGGRPTAAALEVITELEGLDRDRYAGPVGWVDARGNGRWAVGIRSAIIEGQRARCFAGVGIVADSDPESELAETRAKLQTMLSSIVRP